MSSTSQTGVTTTFAYDAFQREVSQTDGRGNTTEGKECQAPVIECR